MASTGKPLLPRTPEQLDLRFNLSHSGDLALCACILGRDVGIDVEALQSIRSADQIARRYFAPEEFATYQTLSDATRPEGFYVRWTMKEAYIKARGSGLSLPLDAFAISSAPDPSGFHWVRSRDKADDQRWRIVRLSPPAGYIASLAVEGQHPSDLPVPADQPVVRVTIITTAPATMMIEPKSRCGMLDSRKTRQPKSTLTIVDV